MLRFLFYHLYPPSPQKKTTPIFLPILSFSEAPVLLSPLEDWSATCVFPVWPQHVARSKCGWSHRPFSPQTSICSLSTRHRRWRPPVCLDTDSSSWARALVIGIVRTAGWNCTLAKRRGALASPSIGRNYRKLSHSTHNTCRAAERSSQTAVRTMKKLRQKETECMCCLFGERQSCWP